MSGCDWGEADLSRVRWEGVGTIGEERDDELMARGDTDYVRRCHVAAETYRELAQRMANIGQDDLVAKFGLKAEALRRKAWRAQWRNPRELSKLLGSGLVYLVAGNGFKLYRLFVTYLVVVFVFSLAYWLLGQDSDGAVVLAILAFHGRGLFGQTLSTTQGVARVAAAEAVVGLLLEVVFIATLTRKLFQVRL